MALAKPISTEMCSPAAPVPLNASLLSICQAMGSSLELTAVLDTILNLTLQEMQAQEGSILLFNQHQDRLEMLATQGLPDEIVRKGYIPRKGSIAEWVIQNNQPLILNEKAKNKHYESIEDRRQIYSSMCVPLRVAGQVIGTINLNRTQQQSGLFAECDLDVMVILASQAAVAIENSRLHEAMLKSERLAAIGQTVAGISHCIKNVLTGVKGGLSLIDMAGQAEDWTLERQGLDILRRNLDRLSTIVLDMLDYSKEREPQKNSIDLMSISDEVINTVKSVAENKHIDLYIKTVETGLMVNADGQQLYRCLLNLVHNALDATPPLGKVWISAERHSEASSLNRLCQPHQAQAAVVIRVGDTGPGISMEVRDQIFDPFFSTKGSKGTGLGLAVTRKIIQEHGGHIEIESRPEDPAVFAIYLPA